MQPMSYYFYYAGIQFPDGSQRRPYIREVARSDWAEGDLT